MVYSNVKFPVYKGCLGMVFNNAKWPRVYKGSYCFYLLFYCEQNGNIQILNIRKSVFHHRLIKIFCQCKHTISSFYFSSCFCLSLVATSREGTAYPSEAPEFTPQFLVRIVLFNLQFSMYCCVDRCLSVCVFSFRPLHFLSFLDLRLLISPLVSSNFSQK